MVQENLVLCHVLGFLVLFGSGTSATLIQTSQRDAEIPTFHDCRFWEWRTGGTEQDRRTEQEWRTGGTEQYRRAEHEWRAGGTEQDEDTQPLLSDTVANI